MGTFIDMTHHTYGRLFVEGWYNRNKQGQILWNCICICGKTTSIVRASLISGKTQSCGCLNKELLTKRTDVNYHTTHGLSKTREYQAWADMKVRCYNQNNKHFKDYGGRGINVCTEWYYSFPTFLQDMGWRPSTHHSLDRIDNEKDYEPSNCRWATPEQQRSSKRSTILFVVDREYVCLAEAARRAGLKPMAVYARMQRGFPVEQWFSTTRLPRRKHV